MCCTIAINLFIYRACFGLVRVIIVACVRANCGRGGVVPKPEENMVHHPYCSFCALRLATHKRLNRISLPSPFNEISVIKSNGAMGPGGISTSLQREQRENREINTEEFIAPFSRWYRYGRRRRRCRPFGRRERVLLSRPGDANIIIRSATLFLLASPTTLAVFYSCRRVEVISAKEKKKRKGHITPLGALG